MKYSFILLLVILLLSFNILYCSTKDFSPEGSGGRIPILFVTYAEYEDEVYGCLVLCESIRTFAGSLSQAPIRVYLPQNLLKSSENYQDRFSGLSVEIRSIQPPGEAMKYFLGGKPFAAAQAEHDAAKEADLLALLAPNTILIQEPRDFMLEAGKKFAYSPVHHQNIGSLYSKPPDPFWKRLYQILSVPESTLFPMGSLADKKILRPYFNAGSFVVRPQYGILEKWAESFKTLYQDTVLAELCKQDKLNIFLHQAAMAGAVLKRLKREEMIQLPAAYNYPLFFEKYFDAILKFDSLENIVTLRYEFSFKDLPKDWGQKVKGNQKVISWIKSHFSKRGVGTAHPQPKMPPNRLTRVGTAEKFVFFTRLHAFARY